MRFKDITYWQAHGSIIATVHQNNRVFIVGEYSKWYPDNLGIEKLYRNLILLSDDLLVVFDVIIRDAHSSALKVSAFFHNRLVGLTGVKIIN